MVMRPANRSCCISGEVLAICDVLTLHLKLRETSEMKNVWEMAVACYKLLLSAICLSFFTGVSNVQAEYGDVVINNYAEAAGMRPVIFPHWFHRMRFTCKVCHADLGFKFKAGGSDISMTKVMDGKFCGACHNGEIAWSVENCSTCHSGMPGLSTQVLERTVPRFVAPPPGAKAMTR